MTEASARGSTLVAGGERIRFGPAWLARALSGGAWQLIERVDAQLASGSIELTLPDGSHRRLGGRAPGFKAEMVIHDWRALLRMATGGSIGCYQGWAAGEWTSRDPVQFFALIMANGDALGNTGRSSGPWRWLGRLAHRWQRNTRAGSVRNIHAHYDLGNDFYAQWLGPSMVYSSARFASPGQSLEAAQADKLASIAKRLDGAQRVLEIGCGWGALAGHLHDSGAKVSALSLSEEQLAHARQRFPGVRFLKQDYRDATGQYDGIASVEMVEAVGREYWPDFFDALERLLVPGGRAALQYIAMKDSLFDNYAKNADFIQAYIFPGGMLIREAEFRELAAARGFEWTDQANFGRDYAETLRIWRENFDRALAEQRLPAGFDRRFVDLWRFYLMYCEGGFRSGGIDVAQVTLVKR
jgi:cyclopropane-fatty-acyl-phospholipid synthase